VSTDLSAQQIVERIQKNLSAPWKDSPLDVFCAGKPDTRVTGIATSFAASMEVLGRAAAAGQNLLIVREHPFFSHQNTGYYSISREPIAKDAVCQAPK
jgi:putative NIF3 family GTP cyclohydrolase 1 type 2